MKALSDLVGWYCAIKFEGSPHQWPLLNGGLVKAVDGPMLLVTEFSVREFGNKVWVNVSQIKEIHPLNEPVERPLYRVDERAAVAPE
jgi:hypothetical protein